MGKNYDHMMAYDRSEISRLKKDIHIDDRSKHAAKMNDHPAKNMGNIFKGYNHPLKNNNYGDPVPKSNAFIGAKVAAEEAGKSSFNVGGKEHPVKLSEEISEDLLGNDMNLTGKSYTSDEGGNTSIMPALRNMYGMSKK